jgi:nucleotidyltransferase/DNA polymerase involved in DNA repair
MNLSTVLTKTTSSSSDTRTLRDLQGVGRSIEADFHALGIRTVAELAESDGAELYRRLNTLLGVRHDPCVLDTFRCAVAQARNPQLPSEQTNWWWWSKQRKENCL